MNGPGVSGNVLVHQVGEAPQQGICVSTLPPEAALWVQRPPLHGLIPSYTPGDEGVNVVCQEAEGVGEAGKADQAIGGAVAQQLV